MTDAFATPNGDEQKKADQGAASLRYGNRADKAPPQNDSPFFQSPLPSFDNQTFWAAELFRVFGHDFADYSVDVKRVACRRIAKELATGTRTEVISTSEAIARDKLRAKHNRVSAALTRAEALCKRQSQALLAIDAELFRPQTDLQALTEIRRILTEGDDE